MDRASQTHPYFTRLFLDVDPAGNPIGRGAIAYERDGEKATLWFHVPAPFDNLNEAWADLVVEFTDTIGEQQELC